MKKPNSLYSGGKEKYSQTQQHNEELKSELDKFRNSREYAQFNFFQKFFFEIKLLLRNRTDIGKRLFLLDN